MLAVSGTGRTELVDGSFTTNEAIKLVLSVTRVGATGSLRLLKGSKLAGARATRSRTREGVRRARGNVLLHVVVAGGLLVENRTYAVHIGATNARGRSTTLTVRFRA